MADTGTTHLCELLINIRSSRKYSLRKMAQVCGVSRESIRKYEMGKLIPSNQTLNTMFDNLGIDPKECREARQVLLSVYRTRQLREGGDARSCGPSAQLEIVNLVSEDEQLDGKIESIVNLFFEQVAPDRKNESLEFFLKSKIKGILRS